MKLIPIYSRRSLLISFGGIIFTTIFAPLTKFVNQKVSNRGIANAYLSQWGLPPVIVRRIVFKLTRTTPRFIFGGASLFAEIDGYDMTDAGCFQKNLSLVTESLRRKISQEYGSGQILNCDGWLLSKSEAQLYALSDKKGYRLLGHQVNNL